MQDFIEKIPEQFSFKPVIENESFLKRSTKVIVAGMGGSHLAADLLRVARPDLEVFIYRNYGLPNLSEAELEDSLFIAVSYSGNTEETLDFAKTAHSKGYRVAVIGGQSGLLIDFAKQEGLPYVLVPEGEIPARMSTGFLMVSLLALMGLSEELEELKNISRKLGVSFKDEAKNVANFLIEGIPVIYSSETNGALANYLKIFLNESGKIPAFMNVFPELNHNEMGGFPESGRIKDFRFIVLRDDSDHPRILRRMTVFEDMIKKAGGNTYSIEFKGIFFEKVLMFIMLVNWVASEVADSRGVDPNNTSFIEDFKKMIK